MAWVVGITGGIGSGKSAVTERLERYGVVVVDADIAARTVVAPGTPALNAIADRHGPGILDNTGALNRAALRKIVFEDPAEREWLEGVTHPAIRAEIEAQLNDAASPYVVLSSPLLLESGQNTYADYVVVVDVPEALQIERTGARDNNDEALVRKIMAAQLARKARVEQADELIDNSGSISELHTRVDALHERLLKLAMRHPQQSESP